MEQACYLPPTSKISAIFVKKEFMPIKRKQDGLAERDLPLHEIAGTMFMVDIEKGGLIQVNDNDNIIWFEDLNDKLDHYEMLYDLRDKNWVTPVGPMDDQMITVQIPLLSALDPIGMRQKYGEPENYLQGRTEKQFLENLQAVALRHQGELPRIIIGLSAFEVDVIGRELRHVEYAGINIDLEQMEFNKEEEVFESLYHTESMQLVQFDPNWTSLPQNVIMIQIPAEIRLDPVGIARLHGLNEKAILSKHPYHSQQHATVIFLANTNLPEIIEQNLQNNKSRGYGR